MESNKTRIETGYMAFLTVLQARGRRMESNKTRIETQECQLEGKSAEKVGGWNPIKQGLKRISRNGQKHLGSGRRMESNKTRIETCNLFFGFLTIRPSRRMESNKTRIETGTKSQST